MSDAPAHNRVLPWALLGAGLAAAGIAAGLILARRRQPDVQARRLIGRSERLIGRIEAALAEFHRPATPQE